MSSTDLLETVRAAKPLVVSLAEAVSLAVRVEPELLRRARLGLVPKADASVEADLWFSPLVDAQSTTAFMFNQDVADRLRRRLAEDQDRLRRAWSITDEVHADVAPAIRLEEEVNYLLLAEGAESDRLQRRLQEAVVALVQGGEDRAGVARWALRALSRLPSAVAETEAGLMLTVAARSRLGRPDALPEGVSPDAEWLPWVLPREADHVRVGVRLFEDGLEIGAPDEQQGHVIPLPRTDPLVLQVKWREGTEEQTRDVRVSPDRQTTIRVESPPAPRALGDVTGPAVDESSGHVDWSKLAEGGTRFAFLHATSGTEPTPGEEWFRKEWPLARALAVRGAYHRATAGDGTVQADRFLSLVGPGPNDLLAIDLTFTTDMATRDLVLFVERVQERTGRRPGLALDEHFFPDFEQAELLRDCWLWLRGGKTGAPPPTGWRDYTFRELEGSGNLPVQHFNGDLQALLAFAGISGGNGPPVFTLETAWGESFTIRPRVAPGAITIRAHAGGRSAFVAWRASGRIDGCLGFALHRRRPGGRDEVVANRIGFEPKPAPGRRPSTTTPFQRFTWLDGELSLGDVVQYRVAPMLGSPAALHQGPGSDWSDPVSISTATDPGLTVTFNRGVLGLPGLAALLDDESADLSEMLASVGSEAREYLGGDLRSGLMAFLSDVRERGGSLYAALYELSDPEAVERLQGLRQRAHVLLPTRLQTRQAWGSLVARKVDVADGRSRSGGLFHHRFAVACDAEGNPSRVWIGGANWTPVGLCLQANDATVVDDPDVAAFFLQHWKTLRRGTTSSVTPKKTALGSARITVWFAPIRGAVDLADVSRRLSQAREGLLFATPTGLARFLGREVERARSRQPPIYIRGVVGTTPSTQRRVTLVEDARTRTTGAMASSRFGPKPPPFIELQGRMLVIDPFTSHPIVVTGSHGLSQTASGRNNETLLIVENAPAYAAAHAVRTMALYQHYDAQARTAVGASKRARLGLRADDAWQDRFLSEERQRELAFWIGSRS